MSVPSGTLTDMYRTTPFIDPIPRLPGWHDVRCSLTWTPRGDHPRSVVGDYLDAHAPDGVVFLGCGVEAAADDLGIADLLADHAVAVADLVTAQLARQPAATVVCRHGTARVELLER